MMLNRYLLALVLMVVMGTGSSVVGLSRFGVNIWTVLLIATWITLITLYLLLGRRYQPDWMKEEKQRRLERQRD